MPVRFCAGEYNVRDFIAIVNNYFLGVYPCKFVGSVGGVVGIDVAMDCLRFGPIMTGLCWFVGNIVILFISL
jgi:hypothetical protein